MLPTQTVNSMLAQSGGRDLLMGVAQFLPGVLMPAAERSGNTELVQSLQSLSALAGGYRSTTRLTTLFTSLTKGGVPPKPKTPEEILGVLSWFFGTVFLPMENIAVLSSHGVINRGVAPKEMAHFGPRCVFFWFWSLVFDQMAHALAAAKGAFNESRLRKWLQSFCFFLLAWASMPAEGKVQLLANPEGSVFKPLHAVVELMTVNALPLGPWTRAACGLTATALQIQESLESKKEKEG